MNRIIHIAYDNTDKTLGHYFERCATEVKKVADLIGLNCVLIDSNGLDVKTINAHTANADKYILTFLLLSIFSRVGCSQSLCERITELL